MNDQVFGEAPAVERSETRIKVRWPLRPLNQIEWSLRCAMGEDMSIVEWQAPAIFIEDDEFKSARAYAVIFGEMLSVHEAIAMQQIIYGDVLEQFRRQLIVARECGEGATLIDYTCACAAEGISPRLERISK
jgi:hypothetical protein